MDLNLGAKLFAWCIAILIVSVLVLTFHGLYPLELKYIDLIPWRSFLHSDPADPDPPVRQFSIWSTQDSPEQYFRYVLKVIPKLNKAGARVIVVPVPSSTTFEAKMQDLIRSIAANDNVVFGDALKVPPAYENASELDFDSPENWWADHPMNNIVDMVWGVSSVRANSHFTLFRFVPNQYRESMKSYTVPDVALQAVKKFASIPANGMITQHFNTVSIGPFHIPVWEDGYAYVKASIGPYLNDPIYAFSGGMGDTLRYGGQWIHGEEQSVRDTAWAALSGKIVVFNWPFISPGTKWQWEGYGRVYAQLIGAILQNKFVSRYNQWDLAVVFLSIILAGALVFSLRTPLAVFCMILGQGLIVLVSLWLFMSRDVLYDPTYILFALVMSTFILPVAKVSHERGYFKKRLENAEERGANLEEQLHLKNMAMNTPKEIHGN